MAKLYAAFALACRRIATQRVAFLPLLAKYSHLPLSKTLADLILLKIS